MPYRPAKPAFHLDCVLHTLLLTAASCQAELQGCVHDLSSKSTSGKTLTPSENALAVAVAKAVWASPPAVEAKDDSR